MRVLIVLESEFPPDVRVEHEMNALVEAGHEVDVACASRRISPQAERAGNSWIFRVPMSSFIHKSSVGCLRFPIYFRFWRKFIFGLLRKNNYDAIHICDLPLARIGIEAKHEFNLKFILDLHENWPALVQYAPHTRTLAGRLLSSNRQWKAYEKRVLPEADIVITVIEEARDRILSLGGAGDKVIIVSNTVDITNLKIAPAKKERDDFLLFYAGGINRHRGIQVVLEAIACLKMQNVKLDFHVVGSGSYRKHLESLATELGIGDRVAFLGHRPFDEMIGMLSAADAAIIPHLRTANNDAASPNKLYQYMYLRKPVISSDCTSLNRIINETGSGFIYRDSSPTDLASLLVKLIKERDLLEEKGEKGRRAVLTRYNWNIDKERLITAYNKLGNYLPGNMTPGSNSVP
jgi:glycosyltransferase involved in cell wall biosynthesis